jgi:hypothetical protein
VPSGYLAVAFADYLTGSRSLNRNELHDSVNCVPFVAATTMVPMPKTSEVRGASGLLFRVVQADRMPLLSNDEANMYDAAAVLLRNGLAPGNSVQASDGTTFLYVRSTSDDRLAGVYVCFARRQIPMNGALTTMTLLTACNGMNELVEF